MTTDANGLVTGWVNQSDNSRGVTVAGAATEVTSTNGRKLLRFASPENGGALAYQPPNNAIISAGYTVFAVVKLDTSSNNNHARIHRGAGDSHALFYRKSSGNIEIKANPLGGESRPSASYVAPASPAEVVILTARLTPTSQELCFNGFRVSQSQIAIDHYTLDAATFEIGNGVVGEIGHVLVYDQRVSLQGLNETGAFLANLHGIAWGNLKLLPTSTVPHNMPLPPLQKLIAHRGNSSVAPENTIAAIAAAANTASMTEFDVRVSADGELVVMHDSTLDRTTNGTGSVAALNYYGYMDTLDAGSWKHVEYAGEPVPTMVQSIQAALTQGLVPVIERKTGTAQSYFTALQAIGALNKVHMIAFDWNFIKAFRQLSPETAIGALGGGTFDQTKISQLLTAGANYADWSKSNIGQAEMELARRNLLPVAVWTVDSPSELQNHLTLGVDGITTNFPERLRLLIPSYADWAAAPVNGLNANQREFSDDPDGDGLANGVEHILGTAPHTPNFRLLATPLYVDGKLKSKHTLGNNRVEDINYSYEWSTNLTEWYTTGETSSGGQRVTIAARMLVDATYPDNDQVELELSVTSGTIDRLYFRMRVTGP